MAVGMTLVILLGLIDHRWVLLLLLPIIAAGFQVKWAEVYFLA